MKLCTFTHAGKTRTGIVVGETVVETGVPGTMIDLIRDWDSLKPGLEAKAATGDGISLAEVKLEAPSHAPARSSRLASTMPTTSPKAASARPSGRCGSPRRRPR